MGLGFLPVPRFESQTTNLPLVEAPTKHPPNYNEGFETFLRGLTIHHQLSEEGHLPQDARSLRLLSLFSVAFLGNFFEKNRESHEPPKNFKGSVGCFFGQLSSHQPKFTTCFFSNHFRNRKNASKTNLNLSHFMKRCNRKNTSIDPK